MAKRKLIKKVSVSPIPEINGAVVDTLNVDNKITNAPSVRIVEEIKNNTYVPTDAIIAYDGDIVPDGYEEVRGLNDYSTEEQVIGKWIDGKPLYKRTYTSFTKQTGENLEYYIFDTDTNKNVKKAEGILIIKFDNNYYESVIGSGGIDFGASEFSSNKQSGAIYVTRQVPSVVQYATVGIETTIYYTKNTD